MSTFSVDLCNFYFDLKYASEPKSNVSIWILTNVKSVVVDVRSCANMCPSTFCPLFHALHYSNALGKVYPKDRLHPKVILRFLTNSYYHKLTLVTIVYCFCFYCILLLFHNEKVSLFSQIALSL